MLQPVWVHSKSMLCGTRYIWWWGTLSSCQESQQACIIHHEVRDLVSAWALITVLSLVFCGTYKNLGVPTSVSSLVPRQKVMKMIPTLTRSCDGSHSKRITDSCFALWYRLNHESKTVFTMFCLHKVQVRPDFNVCYPTYQSMYSVYCW